MTADKKDGGAVPPTTHYAIKPCCLICGEAIPEAGEDCIGNELGGGIGCKTFTLRDFGYPVRKVEMADEMFDGFRCNYNQANAGKCKHNNTLCMECFGPDTCQYLAMKRIEGVE